MNIKIPNEDIDYVVRAVGSRWEKLHGQRLLLTGGTGFIGKWLLASFLEANHRLGLSAEVVVVSRRSECFLSEFPQLEKATSVVWKSCDIRDLSSELIGECSFIIHAATDVIASSPHSQIIDTCISGTRRVLDAVSSGSGSRRFLLLSSGAVYGRAPQDMKSIPEDWMGAPDPLSPTSAYGEGKRVSELLCALASETRPGLEVTIARCFAFVGPHLPLDKQFAIGNFILSAMRNENIIVRGDGLPLRAYLYAADLSIWLWTMLFDAPNGRAYNVGGAEGISIAALAKRVNRILHGKGRVVIEQTPQQSVTHPIYIPSIDRIKSELNLNQTIDLDESIRRTACWALKNHLK